MGSSPFRIRGAAAQVAAVEVHRRQVGARAPAQQVVGVGGRLLPQYRDTTTSPGSSASSIAAR